MAVDPKEYENVIIPDYDQLLDMINRGVVKRIRKKPKHKPFPFGFRGGHYLGAPGKDIFFAMMNLNEDQFIDVANRVADLFPTKPPNNHLHWAACIRYIYGCFEKQGCLRSKSDKKRMISENTDWDMSIRFMGIVSKRFKHNKNTYGRVLHYEMLGHRYGDKAIIENNHDYLGLMLKNYKKSQGLAVKCNSIKQTFTPFYWAAHYFYDIGNKKMSARYHILNLQNMEKYCPDTRPGYREKAKTSIKHLRKCLNSSEWKSMRKWIKGCRNKCLKKAIGVAK